MARLSRCSQPPILPLLFLLIGATVVCIVSKILRHDMHDNQVLNGSHNGTSYNAQQAVRYGVAARNDSLDLRVRTAEMLCKRVTQRIREALKFGRGNALIVLRSDDR